MSDDDKSAIDALVDEVMEGRDAAEAAKAPSSATSKAEADADDAPNGEAKKKKISLNFASDDDAEAAGLSDDTLDVDDDADEIDAGELETIRAERDSYLADSQRLAADFANFRKQSEKRVNETAAAQSAGLVRDLLPVLDACDSALVQDPDSAAGPIRSALIGELEKNGLELLAPADGEPFDPEQHEAVMHEPGDGDAEGPVIAEIFRAGYLWKGRVVRPAMVKVVG